MLLLHGTICDFDPPWVGAADLRIDGGRIAARGRLTARPGEETVDLRGGVVFPGLVNAHHHIYSALARGMPAPSRPPQCFYDILDRIWWRLDRALDRDSIRIVARVAAIEAARAGTTTIIDHHASPNAIEGSLDIIAEALGEVGLRGVLCYEVTDRNGPAGRDAGLAETERFLSACRAGDGRMRGLVGAHASFTLADGSLRSLADLARRHGAGIHIHVAEDPCDLAISRAVYGRAIVDRLEAAGLLDDRAIIAHGIHLSPQDLERVRYAGAWLAHNPRSNMNNGVGYGPIPVYGDRAALGTDGISGDLFSEAQAAYFKARDVGADLTTAGVVGLLSSAARLAGTILGLPLGRGLREGAPADLVVLAYDPPTPLHEGNLPAHLVYGMGARHVDRVMVDGRWVVEGGRVVGIDEQAVFREARAEAQRLWDRMVALG